MADFFGILMALVSSCFSGGEDPDAQLLLMSQEGRGSYLDREVDQPNYFSHLPFELIQMINSNLAFPDIVHFCNSKNKQIYRACKGQYGIQYINRFLSLNQKILFEFQNSHYEKVSTLLKNLEQMLNELPTQLKNVQEGKFTYLRVSSLARMLVRKIIHDLKGGVVVWNVDYKLKLLNEIENLRFLSGEMRGSLEETKQYLFVVFQSMNQSYHFRSTFRY